MAMVTVACSRLQRARRSRCLSPAIEIPNSAGGVEDSLALYTAAPSAAPSGKAGGDKG